MVIMTYSAVLYSAAPIPQLKIKVKNAPNELYYLDLLKNSPSGRSNIKHLEDYNRDMIDLLFSFEDDGWYPAFAGGTNAPLWGDLIGVKESDRVTHTFEYFGLPLIYRIIIVTESGDVQVSSDMTRETMSMQSSVTYDYKTGSFITTPPWFLFLVRFVIICMPGILIELIMLKLFKFRLRHNWKPVLLMNLLTQLLLIITISVTLNNTAKILNTYLLLIPTELAMFSIELFIGVKFLQGRTPNLKVIYIVCANFVSVFIEMSCLIPFALQTITNL